MKINKSAGFHFGIRRRQCREERAGKRAREIESRKSSSRQEHCKPCNRRQRFPQSALRHETGNDSYKDPLSGWDCEILNFLGPLGGWGLLGLAIQSMLEALSLKANSTTVYIGDPGTR